MELEIQTSENLLYYTKKIKNKIDDIATGFFNIGYYLWEIKHHNYFSENGYKDVYEFAEKELNFKKISTHNFIAIVDKYADWSQGAYPKMWIAEKYKKFGYSQLTEMLSLAPEHRENINSEMTIKQIREVKKEIKFSVQEVLPGQINILDADFEVVKDAAVEIVPAFIYENQIKIIESLEESRNNLIDELNVATTFQNKYKNLDLKYTALLHEQNNHTAPATSKDNILDYLNKRLEVLRSLAKGEKKSKSNDYFLYLGGFNEVEFLIRDVERDFELEVN